MANTSISNLAAGTTVSATDIVPNVQTAGVGPVKTTAAQLRTYMIGAGAVNVSASQTLTVPTSTTLSGGTLREALAADRTYYVATTGSDSNNGLAVGTPFLTIQKAINVIYTLDLAGFTVTVQIADGTYTAGFTVTRTFLGGPVIVQGNSGAISNVIISTTSASAISVTFPQAITIRYLKVQTTTSGNCINVQAPAVVTLNQLDFGACAGAHIAGTTSANIVVLTNTPYTISGGATRHIDMRNNSSFTQTLGTVTITGTPNFSSAFAYAIQQAGISLFSPTYSGSATGSRYFVSTQSIVNVYGGGASFLPGNSAGSVDAATYGVYA